jgi:hypothetical protein
MLTYEGSITELDIVEEEKDIGFIIDSNLHLKNTYLHK